MNIESGVISAAGTREAVSFCRICGGGCGTRLTIGPDERILSVRGDPDNPLTKGYACFKGLRGGDAHNHPDRLLHALKKQPDGSFAPIAVEQALDEIAERMASLMDEHGPDAVGAFCGNGSMPNGTAYPMVRSWVEAIGSTQYYSTLTIDQSAKMVSFGRLGAWAGGQQEIDEMDVVLMFGSNPLVSHAAGGLIVSNPVRELKELVANGLKVITVDPRHTETSHFATLAVQPYPAQDAAICAGLIRMILAEGWHDGEFCADHVGAERMEALHRAVEPFNEQSVESRAGLNPGELRAIATMFARDAKKGIAYASTGPNMTPYSNLAQHMVEVLNVVCGRFPRAGEKVRRSNPQGPAMPKYAMAIPATRPWDLTGPGRIRGVKQIFGEKLSGTLADEILTPGEGQLRALVVAGGNIALSLPNQEKAVKALQALDLLVVIDPWMGPTSRLADYVLAPKLQYERPDLAVNIAGFDLWPSSWVQYTQKIIEPPPGSDLVDDWYVFWALAKRLGKVIDYAGQGPMDMETPPTGDDVLALKMKSAWVPFAEMQKYPHGHDFAEDLGVVLPPPPGDLPKFDVMPEDVAQELADFAVKLDGSGLHRRDGHEYRFLMVTRRLRETFNSTGTQLEAIRKRTPTNPAWFNGADLDLLGVREGDPVRLRTAHGQMTFIAARDDKLRTGCVQTSHGWGSLPQDGLGPEAGVCVNALIDDERHVEPINAMPHFSGVPVDVQPLPNS